MTRQLHMSRRTFLKVSAGGVVALLAGGYLLRDSFLNDGNPSSTATDVVHRAGNAKRNGENYHSFQ